MRRVTRADLQEKVGVLNRILPGHDYEVTWAYGQPRLYRDGGSVEVSPRLATGALSDWMSAYIAGIHAAVRS
jgi:hypothetical protein